MKPWKEYENRVLDYFQKRFPNSKIENNVRLFGRLSETKREIDILLSTTVFGCSMQLAIECKDWTKKLDVADIDSFIGKLKDVGISKGIMISKLGYSEAAYVRARKEIGVQLQVLDFDNLPCFYNFWANPYRGNVGAIVFAPNGWLVNIHVPPYARNWALCSLNPFEFSAEEAYERKQFMYFNINSVGGGIDLERLLSDQDAEVLKKWPKSKISYWEEKYARGGNIKYRQINYPEKGHFEFTGALQCDDFYAYCVYIVPIDHNADDLARLHFVMDELLLIKIDNVDPNNSHEAWTDLLVKGIGKST